MTLLYINDTVVDIDPKTKIGITRQVNNIAELKNRQADYTNQFTLPPSEKNRTLLENAEQVQNLSRSPYRKIPARLSQTGVETVGYVIVTGAGTKGYSCVFYSGNLNFFSLIEGKKISDLNLSDLEHEWNMTNVIDSRNNQWDDSGYIYPLIDTVGDGINFLNVAPAVEWRWLTPWVFMKRIWDQIHKEAGFTYSGKFLQTDRFNNLVTNLVANKPQSSNMTFRAIHGTITPFPQNVGVEQTTNYIRHYLVIDDSNSQAVNFPGTASNPTSQVFNPILPGLYSFDFNVNIVTAFFAKVNRIEIVVNEVTGGLPIQRRVVKTFYPGTDFNSLQCVLKVEDVEIATDEMITMRLFFYPLTPATHHNQFFIQPDTGITLTGAKFEKVLPGLTWKIKENLYDMTQTDFIKNICQRFCLIPDAEKLLNEIEYFQFSEIVDNIGNAYDWSDKVTHNSALTFRNNQYGQNSLMKWADAKDFFTKEGVAVDGDFGDYEFTIDDTALEIKKTVLELAFHPSMMVLRFQGIQTPKILYHDKDNPVISDWTEDVGPRMLSMNRVSGSNFAYLDLGVPTTTVVNDNVPFCYFKDQSQSFDLTFESASKSDYKDLIRVLQTYKALVEQCLLSPVDVSQFSFKRPLFIKKHGSYFYMIKIPNYFDGQYCGVEIIKIN